MARFARGGTGVFRVGVASRRREDGGGGYLRDEKFWGGYGRGTHGGYDLGGWPVGVSGAEQGCYTGGEWG